jgi:2-oxoglutarate ferredoxin oxidoreductase subunit beta
MTGGQYSPTTPYGSMSTTSLYGHLEHPFSIAELAVTAGAAWVGRGTVYHATLLDQLIEAAILKRGFAVVEAMSHCHTLFGRKNLLGGPAEMMRLQKEVAVRVEKAKTMSPEELAGKITIGVLTDRDLPIYTQEYHRVREVARQVLEGKIGKT